MGDLNLESSDTPLDAVDHRPKIEIPPPVQLVAIEDCSLSAPAGIEIQLDEFYVHLLKFDRDEPPDQIVYRAENFRLRINVLEVPSTRTDLRPLGIMVPSLPALIRSLDDREIRYERLRGLVAGTEIILVLDPAGNMLEISEYKVAI